MGVMVASRYVIIHLCTAREVDYLNIMIKLRSMIKISTILPANTIHN